MKTFELMVMSMGVLILALISVSMSEDKPDPEISHGEICADGHTYIIFLGDDHSRVLGTSIKFINGKPAVCENENEY